MRLSFSNDTDLCVSAYWQAHHPLIKPIIFTASEKRSKCLFKNGVFGEPQSHTALGF